MQFIPSRIHGAQDFVLAAVLLTGPWLVGLEPGSAAAWALAGAGLVLAATSGLTNYEWGLVRRIPVPLHSAIDLTLGLALAASPWLLGFHGEAWAPHAVLGSALVLGALTVQPRSLGAEALALVAAGLRAALARPCIVDGEVVCLDDEGRTSFRALQQRFHLEDATEVEAAEKGIANFIKLDGNIGCLVNGAGLAMATMDSIKLAGGEPANFLDIATANDVNKVVDALMIISRDPAVKAILVNIFGGMARVDVIAEGIIQAQRQMTKTIPVVARLAGTNVEEGERLIRESGLPVIRADDLGEAARKSVEAAKSAA